MTPAHLIARDRIDAAYDKLRAELDEARAELAHSKEALTSLEQYMDARVAELEAERDHRTNPKLVNADWLEAQRLQSKLETAERRVAELEAERDEARHKLSMLPYANAHIEKLNRELTLGCEVIKKQAEQFAALEAERDEALQCAEAEAHGLDDINKLLATARAREQRLREIIAECLDCSKTLAAREATP